MGVATSLAGGNPCVANNCSTKWDWQRVAFYSRMQLFSIPKSCWRCTKFFLRKCPVLPWNIDCGFILCKSKEVINITDDEFFAFSNPTWWAFQALKAMVSKCLRYCFIPKCWNPFWNRTGSDLTLTLEYCFRYYCGHVLGLRYRLDVPNSRSEKNFENPNISKRYYFACQC